MLKNKTKLVRKRALHRTKMFLKYCFCRAPKDPVFVIATRRSGSNLLIDYLNSIPGASFHSEILNEHMAYGLRLQGVSKKAALRHLAHSINYSKHRLCGAKLISNQLQACGIVLDDLRSLFPNARFIILYRQSLLDQFISLKIAAETDVWRWTGNGFKLPGLVFVDPKELAAFSDEIRTFYQDVLASSWVDERSIVMSYEELASSPQALFDDLVFPFLGVPSSKVSSVTKKQNTKKPEEIVYRYEQIMRSINEDSLWLDLSGREGEELCERAS